MAGSTGITVGRINVKVSPDTRQFRRELKRELDSLEKSLKGEAGINARLDGGQARADLQRTMAAMKAEGAKGFSIKAKVDVDKSQIGQVGSLAGAGAGVSGAGAEAGLKGLGGAVSAGPYAAIAVAVAAIAAAGPAVAVVSGALAAIPGVLATVAAPLAAVAAGIDGIKAAAGQLEPLFNAMKQTVSAVFEQSLTPILAQLAQVFPTITAGLSQVAAGMSTAFGGVVNALTSTDGLAAMQSIFQNIGAALAAAAPGIQAFTTGLLQMASSFTGLLPNMAETFNSLGASFGTWVTQMTTANAQGVTPLQSALKGLGTIVASIGPALGTMFNQGLKLLQDPSFIERVSGLVDAIGKIGVAAVAVSPFVLSLADGFTRVVNEISNLIRFLQNLPATISGALQAAQAVVAGAVSAIQAAVSGGFNALVGIVQGAWDAVVGAISAGVAAAVAAASQLGGQIVSAVSGFVGQMVEAGRNLIMGLVNGIKSAAGAVIEAAKGVVSSAVNAAKSLLGIASPSKVFHGIGVHVGEGFGNGLQASTQQVADAAKNMVDSATDQFKKADWGNVIGKKFDATIEPKVADGGYDWNSKFADMANAPVDFVTANAQQAMGDLGMSGGGLFGALMDYGIDFAKQGITNVFNTSNVDDTLAIHQNQTNRQSLGVVSR